MYQYLTEFNRLRQTYKTRKHSLFLKKKFSLRFLILRRTEIFGPMYFQEESFFRIYVYSFTIQIFYKRDYLHTVIYLPIYCSNIFFKLILIFKAFFCYNIKNICFNIVRCFWWCLQFAFDMRRMCSVYLSSFLLYRHINYYE